MSCSSSTSDTTPVNAASESLFKSKCARCHGLNGDKQLSGAKKLTESVLSVEEIGLLVTNGLRQMPSFKTQLTSEEIQNVSAYAFSFRNKTR